eukprot:7586219-Ditylum_brightwellii.AAC.1
MMCLLEHFLDTLVDNGIWLLHVTLLVTLAGVADTSVAIFALVTFSGVLHDVALVDHVTTMLMD